MNKKIEHILLGREKKITDDETVKQPLPHKDFRFANPFIVIHHIGPTTIQPGSKSRIHPHPHRGFSPYTFMLQGEGYHRDNAGNDEIIKAGGVQWMFAGKGILHSEGPTNELLNKGGVQEAIQLWINAPASKKWNEPFYQSATKNELPEVLKGRGINLRLASGNFDGKTGPIKNFTPIISVIGELSANTELNFPATEGYWTLIYIIKGTLLVNNTDVVSAYHLIVFSKDENNIQVFAKEDTQLLFLSAEPVNEPVAAKDNFVMNSEEEIEQAITDYRNGVFGTLSS